jgi:hypothetical protein
LNRNIKRPFSFVKKIKLIKKLHKLERFDLFASLKVEENLFGVIGRIAQRECRNALIQSHFTVFGWFSFDDQFT